MLPFSLRSLLRRSLAGGLICVLFGAEAWLLGQTPAAGPPPAQPAPAAQTLSPDQLDDLVAPIALYPDPLLSQVLVATTYPLEVVEAQQWLQQNRSLSGTQLMDAARQQNWDPSVQALVAFPDVLARLTQNIRWTTDLGNAFLAQQSDVMGAVQRMRQRAQANGRLESTPQQNVTTESQGGQTAIQIQPADPQVIYVPYYDPSYVWGPPAWGYYPYLGYPAFGFGFWPGIDIGFCFGGWGGWGFGGWGWGWGPNWFGGNIFVNHGFFNRYGFRGGFGSGFGRGFAGTSIWAHNPGHRLGVAYPNRQLSNRYQAASAASRANLSRSFSNGSSFGRSPAGRNAYGEPYGASRGMSQSERSYGSRYGGSQYGAARQAFQGGQSYRGYSPGTARSYQGFQGGSRPSYNYGLRQAAPAMPRSYGGGGARSFGGASRSFSGGARSFGGGGHSFGGGGHSFGGGGHGGGRR